MFIRRFLYAPDPDPTGGAPNPKPDDKPDPKKIELTEAELADRIKSSTEAALKRERETAEAKAAKDKEDREKREAEEQGKFKELSEQADAKRQQAEQERDEAKMEAKKLSVKDELRDHLAEHHPEYIAVAKYIMPLVDFDLKTDEADIAKRIKAAAEQYVKDNPRKTGATTPAAPGRNQPAKPGQAPVNRNLRNFSVARSRF